jgi:hypothetical protein
LELFPSHTSLPDCESGEVQKPPAPPSATPTLLAVSPLGSSLESHMGHHRARRKTNCRKEWNGAPRDDSSRRWPPRGSAPGTSEVGEALIQQRAGLMCRLHLRLRMARGWYRRHRQPAEAAISGSAAATDGPGDAVRVDVHVEVRPVVVDRHHVDEWLSSVGSSREKRRRPPQRTEEKAMPRSAGGDHRISSASRT